VWRRSREHNPDHEVWAHIEAGDDDALHEVEGELGS
jgi:hypothetical protein